MVLGGIIIPKVIIRQRAVETEGPGLWRSQRSGGATRGGLGDKRLRGGEKGGKGEKGGGGGGGKKKGGEKGGKKEGREKRKEKKGRKEGRWIFLAMLASLFVIVVVWPFSEPFAWDFLSPLYVEMWPFSEPFA